MYFGSHRKLVHPAIPTLTHAHKAEAAALAGHEADVQWKGGPTAPLTKMPQAIAAPGQLSGSSVPLGKPQGTSGPTPSNGEEGSL